MSAKPLVIAASALLFSLAASFAHASFIQQGAKLVGTGAVGTAQQGRSVAVSADGNTAIVGGSGDNGTGAAWVYTRSGGVWSQEGAKLVGTGAVGASAQGVSVSISADGNTAIVGGANDNAGAGAAWVYTRSGGVWSQEGAKLVGTGAVGAAGQGYSVAVSADGNTAVVGGWADNGYIGAAWVYTRSGGVWSQEGAKLVGTGAAGTTFQGISVAVSADGNTAVVGGPGSPVGAAWVYTRSGGVWSQEGAKLVGTGTVGGASQGSSVAVSADGNTAIVGGNGDNSGVGAAWVFTRSAGVWSQQGAKLVADAAGQTQQGTSVAVSADGNTAVVGGPGASGFLGAAWVYTRSSGVWSQQGAKLVGTGAVGGAQQGESVAVSADGNTAVVGGYDDNASRGAAWVFFAPDAPVIASAADIPNDQGGWLRLTVNRSAADDASDPLPVSTYGVWRLVPGTLLFPGSNELGAVAIGRSPAPAALLNAPKTIRLRTAIPAGLNVQQEDGHVFATGGALSTASAFPPGTWELVASIPALQQAQYVVAVPTISNAAPNDFVVTAHTTMPSNWSVSDPASGQSVDNLAPAQPTPFTAAYANGATNLQWGANTESDFGSYRVYRGSSSDFTPGVGNLIVTQSFTGCADVGVAGSYYKLSAVDVNGNESGFALVTPDGTTGVSSGNHVAFALEGVRPNPASGNSLHVAFALPAEAAARLDLLDVSGRRVLAREVGSLGVGRHTVNLAEGRTVAPGLYWVRLTQGANRRTTRVVVVE